ncbi:TetR/AcrR family transcriptional regulator [Sneathiella aquimaris]|uniref:TetR/AcrR family transcriptional regulator n=1 Tax=Sneathiella aquimaris TaxID=2599305 RepID=UPI00146C9CCF|nr:TetR/AcrR family transcriptional regulator [Sneathiella aquimaris]
MTQTNSSDRVETILETAEKRIRQGGFNQISFRDIAAEVGIKSSSVHYHFPKKEDLGRAVIERYGRALLDSLGPADRPDEKPAHRIQRLGEAYLHALQSQNTICLGCVLGAESAGLPTEVQKAVEIFFQKMLNWTETAVTGAKSTAADADYIISALQGAMVLSIALKKPDPLEKTARLLVQMIDDA